MHALCTIKLLLMLSIFIRGQVSGILRMAVLVLVLLGVVLILGFVVASRWVLLTIYTLTIRIRLRGNGRGALNLRCR